MLVKGSISVFAFISSWFLFVFELAGNLWLGYWVFRLNLLIRYFSTLLHIEARESRYHIGGFTYSLCVILIRIKQMWAFIKSMILILKVQFFVPIYNFFVDRVEVYLIIILNVLDITRFFLSFKSHFHNLLKIRCPILPTLPLLKLILFMNHLLPLKFSSLNSLTFPSLSFLFLFLLQL